MSLRIELALLSARAIVAANFDTKLNRFVVTELVSPDPRMIDALCKQAEKLGLEPFKKILEANARTRGGAPELPWALLANYSMHSQRTQSIVRRSFEEIFKMITLVSGEFPTDHNQLFSYGPIRLYLSDSAVFWEDHVDDLCILID
jgi:hypothetical protein